MCLGLPGKIVAWVERDPLFARATVEFEGVTRECHMACVPDAEVGEFVIVHAGVAITCVDEEQARRALQEWQKLNEPLNPK